jgi:integral membrane protein (TIGR01906 family)
VALLYHGRVGLNLARGAGSVVVGLSAAIVLIAAGVLVFLNPLWVGFEQARTNADRFTGYTLDDVHRVTNAVLSDLILGPPAFLQQVAGVPVFDPRERQHLADVRGVLLGFFALVLVAIVVLMVAGWRARDRDWLWRSVAAGTAVLAGAVVLVGALFAVFFDAAFDLFHRLLFAGGSYSFDPLQERLVQLFPEDFWSETSIALAIVILVLAVAVTWVALRRAATSVVSSAPAQQAVRREGAA